VLIGTHFWGLRSRTVAPVACLCQRVLHSERQNVSVVSFSGYPFATQCLLCTVPPGCTVTNCSLVHIKHLYVVCVSYSSPCYSWHDQLIIVPIASLLRSVRIDSLRTVKIHCSFQRVNVFFGKTGDNLKHSGIRYRQVQRWNYEFLCISCPLCSAQRLFP
jgi:hypothetical protein